MFFLKHTIEYQLATQVTFFPNKRLIAYFEISHFGNVSVKRIQVHVIMHLNRRQKSQLKWVSEMFVSSVGLCADLCEVSHTHFQLKLRSL